MKYVLAFRLVTGNTFSYNCVHHLTRYWFKNKKLSDGRGCGQDNIIMCALSYGGMPTDCPLTMNQNSDVTGWNLTWEIILCKLISTAEYETLDYTLVEDAQFASQSDRGFACQPMTVSQKVRLSPLGGRTVTPPCSQPCRSLRADSSSQARLRGM